MHRFCLEILLQIFVLFHRRERFSFQGTPIMYMLDLFWLFPIVIIFSFYSFPLPESFFFTFLISILNVPCSFFFFFNLYSFSGLPFCLYFGKYIVFVYNFFIFCQLIFSAPIFLCWFWHLCFMAFTHMGKYCVKFSCFK